MIKEYVTFLGVGQCGCNIAYEAEQLGYDTLLINTSLEDLNSIKGAKHKYHIKNGEGASKKRTKAKELAIDSIDEILDKLNQHCCKEIVVLCFSMSGGTGSALAPIIAKILSDTKIVVCVAVIPDETDESIIACDNTYQCISELEQVDTGSIFILDNKKNQNKFAINKEFINIFDCFLSAEYSSKKGNMDNAEIKEMLSTKGFSILTKVSRDKTTTANLINSVYENRIYSPIETDKALKYIGLSLSKENVNKNDLAKEFGEPLDSFVGYDQSYSMLIVSGLTLPITRINQIKSKVDLNKDNILNNLTSKSLFSNAESITDLFTTPKRQKDSVSFSRDSLLKHIKAQN